MFVVDARSFRDQELEDANSTSPADIGRFLAETLDSSRTMLGVRLKHDLLEADEDGELWKFVIMPEPFQNLRPLAAADRYDGYAAERNQLLRFIDDHDIDNVVFVSADLGGGNAADRSGRRGFLCSTAWET